MKRRSATDDSDGPAVPVPVRIEPLPLQRYAAIAAVVLVVVALAGVAWIARPVIVSVFLGLFLAAGLDPMVSRLQRLRLRRGLAVLVVVCSIVVILGLFAALALAPAVSEINQLAKNAPAVLDKLSSRQNPVGRLLHRPDVQRDIKSFAQRLPGYLASSAGKLVGVLGTIAGGIAQAVTVFVLMIYFMLAWPRIMSRVEQAAGTAERAAVVREAVSRIGGYVTGQLIISALAGVLAYAFLRIIGVPYAALLGLVVGFCDLIPQIGATVGAVVCGLVALSDSLTLGIAAVVFIFCYQHVENYLIAPRIFAKAVELSPAAVFVAALAGISIGGFIGAIIALPLAAALKVVARYLLRGRFPTPSTDASAAD